MQEIEQEHVEDAIYEAVDDDARAEKIIERLSIPPNEVKQLTLEHFIEAGLTQAEVQKMSYRLRHRLAGKKSPVFHFGPIEKVEAPEYPKCIKVERIY